jgi:hypothetical protein
MERENSTMDFEQNGMGWNLKNWPFDHLIIFVPCILAKLAKHFSVHI